MMTYKAQVLVCGVVVATYRGDLAVVRGRALAKARQWIGRKMKEGHLPQGGREANNWGDTYTMAGGWTGCGMPVRIMTAVFVA